MNELIYKYLTGGLDANEQQKLLAWLEAGEANRKLFLRLYHIRLAMQYNGEEIRPEEEFDKLRGKIDGRRQKTSRRRFYYAAAGAAACLALAALVVSRYVPSDDIVEFANKNPAVGSSATETTLVLSDDRVVLLDMDEASINYQRDSVKADLKEAIPLKESARYNQLVVPYGKKSCVTFSDGTRLWANAGTRLVYPVCFDSRRREIFVDGEVYLDVSPDPSRPFVVRTGNMSVKVLGTKFGITDYKNEEHKRVVLVSGSVEVKNISRDETFLLAPSQMYVSDGPDESVDRVDVAKYVSWIDGKYSFDMEPLGTVLSRLSRFYNVDLECNDRAAMYLCSGTLDFQMTIESILTGLAYSIPIRYVKTGEEYIISIR